MTWEAELWGVPSSGGGTSRRMCYRVVTMVGSWVLAHLGTFWRRVDLTVIYCSGRGWGIYHSHPFWLRGAPRGTDSPNYRWEAKEAMRKPWDNKAERGRACPWAGPWGPGQNHDRTWTEPGQNLGDGRKQDQGNDNLRFDLQHTAKTGLPWWLSW